jgi:hypothetical protein
MVTDMIYSSGKLRVLVIRRVIRLPRLLSEPILFLALLLIFVFFLVIIVFLGFLPGSDWLSPGRLARLA